MRTTDFSRVPAIGQAGVMVVASTRLPGPTGWLRHVGRHRGMLAQLRRTPGYRAHRTFWQPPSTLGLVAWFDTLDDLVGFARTGLHPALAAWVEHRPLAQHATADDGARQGRRPIDGTAQDGRSRVRVYRAHESGYSNGVWRAEENVMRNIETFTPVGDEEVGPPVQRRRRTRDDVQS